MSGSSLTGLEALRALAKMGEGEGWLLSVTIAAHHVKLTGDFANVDLGLDGNKTLIFSGVSGLRLNYNQSVFGVSEDDISTIDVMKLRDAEHPQAGSNRIGFEFSYGALEFIFEEIEIS